MKIGQEVPDVKFDVYHKGKFSEKSFKDFRGKWVVLLFYPGDFTFICPTELEEAAELYADFQKEGAEIISFSTDTKFSHKAWHDTSKAIGKVEYPMAADPTGAICKTFGTYIDEEVRTGDAQGMSLRGTFIINPEGWVVSMDIHDNSVGRNAAETLRRVQAAKFVAENPGQVCPANWKPGGKTLKPGEDLVGKI